MAYTNLPALHTFLQDGNLGITYPAGAPGVLIMGVSGRGLTYQPFNISGNALSQATVQYGLDGDLVRLGYEAKEFGADRMILNRVAAEPLKLQHIGGTGADAAERAGGGADNGFAVTPRYGGTEWGTRIGIAYSTEDLRLVLEDRLYGVVIYDNVATNYVNLQIVDINGTSTDTTAGSDIGSVSPLTSFPLNTAQSSDTYMYWYPGDNGTNPSRMKLFEGLYKGFDSMEGIPFDYAAFPAKATLDAPSGTGTDANSWVTGRGTTYPTVDSNFDRLNRVYAEDIGGKTYFYWDCNGDDKAELWNIEGTTTSLYCETSLGGHVFAAGDFHEANFAYLLAHKLHKITENDHFCQGVIGVEFPNLSMAEWLGSSPTLSTSVSGGVTVIANGTGLLGNKIMAGQTTYRGGTAHGGLISTTEGWIDGTEEKDDNEHFIDIGKYISVIATPSRHNAAPGRGAGYFTISAPAYAGFRTTLSPDNAPTEEVVNSKGLMFRVPWNKLDELAGLRYTTYREKRKGIVVSDAPSAARPDSDYQRQGTINIVALAVEALRQAAEPYLGKVLSAEREIALQKQLNEALGSLKGNGFLRDFQLILVITDQDRVQGKATCFVDILAPFELRQINFPVALRQGL